MNEATRKLATQFISSSYIKAALEARNQRENLIKILFASRRMPEEGWDEQTIELLLQELSLMDTNNFLENVGVGEREGRIYCPLVSKRHFHFAHGVPNNFFVS
jgi:O-phospho-L-seryl-tRNASec:L-selenocysteinyl-tRNA synthase